MIEIKELNKNLLFEYINSVDFGKQNDIPITIHRALSQIKNPRLDDSDIILLLAYENNNLIGYLGILPDKIFTSNKPIKIGWLSCFWVSENARGKGVGVKLISKSLELWNNNILSGDYVPFSKKVYDKTKLFAKSPYTKTGLRLYVKSDLQTILPPKKAFFSHIKSLLKFIDFGINSILNIRLMLLKKDTLQIKFEYLNHIDDEAHDLILKKQESQIFKRNKEDLNWIINNPWILSANENNDLDKKYYFTATAKYFKFHTIKIRNSNNNVIGLMIFAQRNNTLKLPFFYHDNCINEIINALNYHLITWKIKTFTTYNSELADALQKKKTPALYKKTINRNYMVSLSLEDKICNQNVEIQDGDGDCCFT